MVTSSPRRCSLSMMLSSVLMRYSMWWMGEWSYSRANSSSSISICVTATFRALRYRWVTRTMPAASSCSSAVIRLLMGISFKRMLPLFSIITGRVLLTSL